MTNIITCISNSINRKKELKEAQKRLIRINKKVIEQLIEDMNDSLTEGKDGRDGIEGKDGILHRQPDCICRHPNNGDIISTYHTDDGDVCTEYGLVIFPPQIEKTQNRNGFEFYLVLLFIIYITIITIGNLVFNFLL